MHALGVIIYELLNNIDPKKLEKLKEPYEYRGKNIIYPLLNKTLHRLLDDE